jgi:hypothetical protein
VNASFFGRTTPVKLNNAGANAARYELRLGERLGFGIHGSVHVIEHKIKM